MKRVALLVVALSFSSANAANAAYTNSAEKVLIKARATKGDCVKILGKTLATSWQKSLGTIICAIPKYNIDDTKDFIDITFNDNMERAWSENNGLSTAMFSFDEPFAAMGVMLMDIPAKAIVIFNVGPK